MTDQRQKEIEREKAHADYIAAYDTAGVKYGGIIGLANISVSYLSDLERGNTCDQFRNRLDALTTAANRSTYTH